MSFTFLVVEGTVEGEFNSVDWSEFNSEEAIDYIAFDKFEQKISEKIESVRMGMYVQGVQDQKCQKESSISLLGSIFDPTLVKPKCV